MTLDEVLEIAAAEDWDFRKTFQTSITYYELEKIFLGF
jgi:hypothetical protein